MSTKPAPLCYETCYHIYNRGNNRETVFLNRDNYLYFLQLYTKHFYPYAQTFAYCLMPNHFHFLVGIRAEDEVVAVVATRRVSENPSGLTTPSQAFGNLCNAYTKAMNKRYGRTGSLFEHPFGRIPVDSERYLYNLVRYIHYNPQKHGFVDDFRDWPYSSYGAYLTDKPTRLGKTAVLDWFDGLDGFAAAHQSELDERPIRYLLGDDVERPEGFQKPFGSEGSPLNVEESSSNVEESSSDT